MIAVWPYIDPTLVTQRGPQGSGEQVPNTLNNEIGTPSVAREERTSSGRQEAEAADAVPVLEVD